MNMQPGFIGRPSGFEPARRRGWWARLRRWLRRRPVDLVEFNGLRERISVYGQRDLGVQTIPVAQIVGSVGQSEAFDRSFMPRRENTRERWQHVERAMDAGRELGAIQVYKMGSLYFVIDGNHRVSVSRSQDREYIDAHVIEIEVDEDIRSTAEARAISRRQR